ncbi:MAG: FAD-dependent oxidoreductase [Granulosicoccus sp.]
MADTLPSHASVIVIGGGVMGCSTLYHLAKLGVTDAVLLERNKLTSGTTWHSAAQVRALRHSRNLTRMIQYSVDLYSQLEAETGLSVGWIQEGSLSIATQADRLIHIKRQEALAQAYGVRATSVSAAEAKERWPLMHGDDVLGAVWSPDDGRVSPSDVCAALVRAAKRQGARLFENTGVTGVITDNNRIRGVETEAGTIKCDAIALCAGLWSREVGAMAGAAVPLLACEHFYLLTKPIEGITGNTPTLSDHDSHLYIRDDSGGLLVGCFEPNAKPIKPGVLDSSFEFGLLPEDWDHFEPMMEHALHRLPVLADAEVKMLLNGPESFTPDGTFMLGETAETRGLFLGCGMNSVGLASGGGAGMNLANCIVNGGPCYDLGEADAKRFAPVFNSIEHLMARTPEILGSHYDIAYPAKQFKTARHLREHPLQQAFTKHQAYTGQMYGWERPLYFNAKEQPGLTFGRPDWFSTVQDEVMAAHEYAAVFDLSTFGKIDVIGPEAEAFLMHTCAGYMNRAPGSVIYSAVLNNKGTFESDLTALRLSQNHYRLFVGTSSIRRDLAWFTRAIKRDAVSSRAKVFDVSVVDVTEQYAVLALMGPEAASIIGKLEGGFEQIAYFKHATGMLGGVPVQVSRMSYVGEYGWEISCKVEHSVSLFKQLVAAGAKPAGLFAQTSMRIEKGFRAMGHELDSDVTPAQAGLDKFMRKGGGFVGYEALAEGIDSLPYLRVVSVALDDVNAVPIGHEPIIFNGRIVGKTTSCSFGYRLGKPVALAQLIEPLDSGSRVELDLARQGFNASISDSVLFDPSGSRMKL